MNTPSESENRTDPLGAASGPVTMASVVTNPDLVDVRDMVVVHAAMLREFRLAPDLVLSCDPSNRVRVRRIDGHLRLVCDLMHHHHTGEDQLLWPVLEPRLSAAERADVAVAEAQHEGLDGALAAVSSARTIWSRDPDPAAADRLSRALAELYGRLAEHLEFEERLLLPVAATKLSPPEWHAIGEAGARSVGARHMLVVLGMFAYEGDPEVLKLMLSSAPGPVRALLPRLAARSYRRYSRRVYGTPRP